MPRLAGRSRGEEASDLVCRLYLTCSVYLIILFIRIVQLSTEVAVEDTKVSIGQVKRDISDLVNRVAYGGERIVLTSRGRPKAAIVSMEDLERLERDRIESALDGWEAWLAESEALSEEIRTRRGDRDLDVEALWEAARGEMEERDAQTVGR